MAPAQQLGLGMRQSRRRRRIMRDSIMGITKPAIRRLARRGGVARMSLTIYDDMREVLKDRVTQIIEKLVHILESSSTARFERKTVTTRDVVFVLNRMGNPVYGFNPV